MKPNLKLKTWDVLRGDALRSIVRSPDLERMCKEAKVSPDTAACVRFAISGPDVAALLFVFVDGGVTMYKAEELIAAARERVGYRRLDID